MTHNPYDAPKAEVTDYVAPVGADSLRSAPRRVSAGRGSEWLSEGWRLFAASPLLWIGINLAWIGAMVALGLLPFVGQLLINMTVSFFSAGLAFGCEAVRCGRPLEFGHLFAGLTRGTIGLATLGVAYLAAMLAIEQISFVQGDKAEAWATALETLGESTADPGLMLPLALEILVQLALWLPVLMSIWFAPTLVILHGVLPFRAMRLSLIACVKNVLPCLVYSLLTALLGFIATIPLLLGWLVLIPWLSTSSFAAYRDIFFEVRTAESAR